MTAPDLFVRQRGPRAGHCACAVDDRFLLIWGGDEGELELAETLLKQYQIQRGARPTTAREGSRRQGVWSRFENARHSHGKSSAFCLGRGILLFLIRGASGIGHILRLGVSG